jgi:hypothetical protein
MVKLASLFASNGINFKQRLSKKNFSDAEMTSAHL